MITEVALSFGRFLKRHKQPDVDFTDEDVERLIQAWGADKTEQERKLVRIVHQGYEDIWKEYEEGKFPASQFERRFEDKVRELKSLYEIEVTN